MSKELEIEVTYLAASLPPNLNSFERALIEDTYMPAADAMPKVRIRRKGATYTFTKKSMVDPNDKGNQQEENIDLTKEEYIALAKGDGRTVSKMRYFMPLQGLVAEIDVFQAPLEGLILVEFEFPDQTAKQAFVKPDFCLADVTQEDFIAGGALAGKRYADIAADLARYSYRPLRFA